MQNKLGEVLEQARHDAGMTRKQTGHPINTVYGWEKGTRAISIVKLIELCTLYGVAPGELLDRAISE